MARSFSLRPAQRIRSTGDFANFRQSAFRWRGINFLLVLKSSRNMGFPRLALITSRRVGGAVLRNCLRRRLREIFRKRQKQLGEGNDWLVVFLPPAKSAKYADLEEEFCSSVIKLRQQSGF